MTTLRLLVRNLVYYRRTHMWVVLGTMVSSALLVSALVTGDSIQYSLRRIVDDRLGATRYALISGDRLFAAHIADDMSRRLGTTVAPVLLTRGNVILEGGGRRMNGVQVVGYDQRFGDIGGTTELGGELSSGEALLNTRISERLDLQPGDEFTLRIYRPDFIPIDNTWAPDSGMSRGGRFTVRAVLSTDEFGAFNLRADQVTPATVFLPLEALDGILDVGNRANCLLVAESGARPVTIDAVGEAFRASWSLTDAGYEVVSLPGERGAEVRSERIFLDTTVIDAAAGNYTNVESVFFYFVNEIKLDERAAPYSFVSAVSGSGLGDDEAVINEWLAEDIGAQPGDRVTLTYFIPGTSRELIEKSSDFRVTAVIPMNDPTLDRGLMPSFPGLTDVESCLDWDPGIPLDMDRIRPKDEAYWNRFAGTPKVILSLNAARAMWRNRFGDLTAMRFPGADAGSVNETLSRLVDPAGFGFFFRDVKNEGIRAGSQSVDFDQLFFGMSFFIIAAALMLTGLLYALNSGQRTQEIGLLMAVGFTKWSIRRLVLLEGFGLAIIGGLTGVVGGLAYNRLVIIALKTVWKGIVGTSAIRIHADPSSLVIGFATGAAVNFATLALLAGNQLKQPIADSQKGITRIDTVRGGKAGVSLAAGLGCFAGAAVIMALSTAGELHDAVVRFYSAGVLLLVGGIALVRVVIARSVSRAGAVPVSIVAAGVRNSARKPMRSIAIAGLLACAIFIVFTVGANRRSVLTDAGKRESGTGGFALVGESTIPLIYDLNGETGREHYNLQDVNPVEVKLVSFRTREGDDASCLNLNRISTPRLLGVDPGELSGRGAFTFVATATGVDPDNPWGALEQYRAGDVVPGVADQTVITWGLGKSVGDTLTYVDERGEPFGVVLVGGLANSVFQGNVIISGSAFMDKYPSIGGSRFFLVDAPFESIDSVQAAISRALEDEGAEVTTTYDRLAQFARVENTYLSIFMILGSLGLVLGSVGIGIVIGRNVSERRGELALLRAVGFGGKAIQALILSEQAVVVSAGILVGTAAALVASLPSLTTPGSAVPYATMAALLLLVAVSGAVWTIAATACAVRKNLMSALRTE